MFHTRNILKHIPRTLFPYKNSNFVSVPLLNRNNKFYFSSQNNGNENNKDNNNNNDDKDKDKKNK